VVGVFALWNVFLPELFPTALRASGAALCYNAGRVLAAAGTLLTGTLAAKSGQDAARAAALAVSCEGFLPMLALCVLPFVGDLETAGRPLPM
jgi:hypothetical protein